MQKEASNPKHRTTLSTEEKFFIWARRQKYNVDPDVLIDDDGLHVYFIRLRPWKQQFGDKMYCGWGMTLLEAMKNAYDNATIDGGKHQPLDWSWRPWEAAAARKAKQFDEDSPFGTR